MPGKLIFYFEKSHHPLVGDGIALYQVQPVVI